MTDTEDEKKIKIEYFDSFEPDPLGRYEQETQMKNNIITNSILELKNQEEIVENRNLDDIELPNNVLLEPEIIVNGTSWHKQVNEFGKYVCRFCDLAYFTIDSLRYHVRMKHTNAYNNIKNTPITSRRNYQQKCHICKKTFENINDLQMHSHTHGLENPQNSCLLCLATFKDYNDLLDHMKNIHESLKKLNVCTVCGYSTSRQFNFKKHVETHTKSNKIKCAYCPFTTNNRANIKSHERTHSKEKLYSCKFDGCEYSGKSQAALRSHRLMHNKEKHMLYCDKCSYSTIYSINLKKHLDTHLRKTLGEKTHTTSPTFQSDDKVTIDVAGV